jgi:hypothetical protein
MDLNKSPLFEALSGLLIGQKDIQTSLPEFEGIVPRINQLQKDIIVLTASIRATLTVISPEQLELYKEIFKKELSKISMKKEG